MDDYRQLLRDGILDEGAFVRATFSGHRHGQTVPWRRVTLRPVLIRGRRQVQISYWDGKQDIAKNYAGPALCAKLEELLELPFGSFYVETTAGALQVRISKRGKAFVQRHARQAPHPPDLRHDRRKEQPLPADTPDPFLQAIGIMTREGRVRASARAKFAQINAFLGLLSTVLPTSSATPADLPLRLIDCGCGSAYLTLAAYHYLNDILQRPTQMTGLDVNEALIAQRAAQSRALGWEGVGFEHTRILDYRPATPPDIVLALHACDTATDEALAQAVRWQSRAILAAPCCHHHLQAQLSPQSGPPAWRPVLRQGILKERLGDILTDTLRALILGIMGYRAEVVEFVSGEHTPKNLLIRAVKRGPAGDRQAVAEYLALRDAWHVRPHLEMLLEDALRGYGVAWASTEGDI